MTVNPEYTVRAATVEDSGLVSAMAEICAQGRIRAYGIQPGGPDYALGVDTQRSEQGLAELKQRIDCAVTQPETHLFLVAEKATEKHLAGLCIAQRILDAPQPHVYMDRVFVDEADEGNGIASAFLTRLIDWAADMPIESEVVIGNQRARGLYERRGFEVVGMMPSIQGFETELERLKIVRKAEKEQA